MYTKDEAAAVKEIGTITQDTWTPELSFGGASVDMVYNVRSGIYVKIGSIVFVEIFIALSAKGTSHGNANISLPFENSSYPIMNVNLVNVTFANQFVAPMGSNQIGLQEVTEAGVVTNLTDTNFANNSMIIISGWYVAV
jgi:hypothetical protein